MSFKYKGNLKVVNTFRHFKSVWFKQAQENRRLRIANMAKNKMTREQIEERYREERKAAGVCAARQQESYGKKFIVYDR